MQPVKTQLSRLEENAMDSPTISPDIGSRRSISSLRQFGSDRRSSDTLKLFGSGSPGNRTRTAPSRSRRLKIQESEPQQRRLRAPITFQPLPINLTHCISANCRTSRFLQEPLGAPQVCPFLTSIRQLPQGQEGRSFSSGTMIAQPLTQLLRIHQGESCRRPLEIATSKGTT